MLNKLTCFGTIKIIISDISESSKGRKIETKLEKERERETERLTEKGAKTY